jgi:hypothetical protein
MLEMAGAKRKPRHSHIPKNVRMSQAAALCLIVSSLCRGVTRHVGVSGC